MIVLFIPKRLVVNGRIIKKGYLDFDQHEAADLPTNDGYFAYFVINTRVGNVFSVIFSQKVS